LGKEIMANLKLNPIPIPKAEDIPVEEDIDMNDEIKHLIETFKNSDATEDDIEVEMAKTRFDKFKRKMMIESIRRHGGS
jgi:hypothetical protein